MHNFAGFGSWYRWTGRLSDRISARERFYHSRIYQPSNEFWYHRTATRRDSLSRSEVRADERSIVTRRESLERKMIGFLDNAKTNADVLLKEVSRISTEGYGVDSSVEG